MHACMSECESLLDTQLERRNRCDGPEYACVRGEACDRDADVIVDAEHLLLVRGQLSTGALDTHTENRRRRRGGGACIHET